LVERARKIFRSGALELFAKFLNAGILLARVAISMRGRIAEVIFRI